MLTSLVLVIVVLQVCHIAMLSRLEAKEARSQGQCRVTMFICEINWAVLFIQPVVFSIDKL